MPSAEARLKKNRCANCFDCPSCGHTLSTRATSMTVAPQVEGVDGQPAKVRNKSIWALVQYSPNKKTCFCLFPFLTKNFFV